MLSLRAIGATLVLLLELVEGVHMQFAATELSEIVGRWIILAALRGDLRGNRIPIRRNHRVTAAKADETDEREPY